MLCPFCLTTLQSNVSGCKDCSRPLPHEYIKFHSGWWPLRGKQPAIVSVVGFRGHGKTVYLASLYYVLQNIVTRSWKEFYRQGLTMNTLQVIHKNLLLLKRGELPESTQRVFPEPNIDRLSAIPQFGNRTLLVFDPPGEAFDIADEQHEAEDLKRFAGFVKHSKCALFLVSLSDMMEEFGSPDLVGDEMYKLLERYNLGMKEMGARDHFQHLIVVYTKADRLLSQVDFPETVAKYLESSEADTVHDVRRYLQGMKQNSLLLRTFTEETLNGRGFLNNAKAHFKSIEFCAVSALGAEPVGDRLAERVAPRRVIDPLLWVLDKSS